VAPRAGLGDASAPALIADVVAWLPCGLAWAASRALSDLQIGKFGNHLTANLIIRADIALR
jgi:hypothetical protein